MKIFNLDCHIGIADIQNIFNQLGHELDIWSISDHHFIMGWERKKVDIVNQYTWKNIDKTMCDNFYNRYKDELKKYDAFLTFYPPAFSMLYEKFDKPIIVCVPLRFEIPFFNNHELFEQFVQYLQKNIDSGKIIPIVNNKFDKEYLKLFTERDWELITGLCDYVNVPYSGKENKFLYCSKFKNYRNWLSLPNIVDKTSIKGYSWTDISNFKALIYLPYTNITMSIFEQYNSNIPMLFPTKEYLEELWERYGNDGVMSELSHWQVFNLKDRIEYKNKNIPDPNDYKNLNSFKYWASLSEFYNEETMKHIEYYDSIGELEYKLMDVDFKQVSEKMRDFNKNKKEIVLNQWNKHLQKIK